MRANILFSCAADRLCMTQKCTVVFFYRGLVVAASEKRIGEFANPSKRHADGAGDRDRAGSLRPLKFEYSKNRVAWRLASRTHQLREQQPCDCFGWRPSDLSYFLSERRSNVHHLALNVISSVVRNTVDGDSHASHQKWTAWAHEARS